MVGAAGGVVLGFAFLRRRAALGHRRGGARARRLRAARLRRPGDHRPLHDARRRRAGDLRRRSPCSAGACSSAGHPWRRRWQAFAGVVALMFVLWLPNQWDLDSTRSTPTSPTRARSSATSPTWPTPAPSSRSAGRSRSPTTAPSPASPSTSTSGRPRSSAPARRRPPRRGYFLKPASPFVIHNFILDPNDPTRFSLTVPPGFRQVASNRSWVLYRRC